MSIKRPTSFEKVKAFDDDNRNLAKSHLITPEKMEAIMNELYRDVRERLTENVYMHPVDFKRVLKEYSNQPYPDTLAINGISIYPDDDIPVHTFFMCTPRQFEIWKALVNLPWIDKSDPTIDLYKIAAGLYENELKHIDEPKFTLQFKPGDSFPSGCTFKPDSIDYLKSDILTKF